LIAYCSDNKCQKARSEKKHKIALEKGTNIRRPRHGESFAELSPAIAALQHPNCKIDLKSLKLNSNEYALFSCESCRIGVLKQLCKARKMVKFFCVSSLCKEKKRAHIRTQDWKTRIEKSGSFQANYPLLAKEWVKSVEPLDLLPSDVTVSSTAEVKWRCHVNKKHIWTGSVDQRSSNPGCPMCNSNVSRQQLRLHAEITGLLGITAKVSPKLKIGKRRIEVDIPLVLDGRKIAIELDGYRWHVDKRDADQDKNRVLSEAGWTVIRIRDNRLSDVKLSYSDLTVYINSNCYYAQDWRDAIASTFLFISGKDLTNYSSYRFEDAYLARLKFYKLGGQ
jgi:very-short-patch-repair endonuclease